MLILQTLHTRVQILDFRLHHASMIARWVYLIRGCKKYVAQNTHNVNELHLSMLRQVALLAISESLDNFAEDFNAHITAIDCLFARCCLLPLLLLRPLVLLLLSPKSL